MAKVRWIWATAASFAVLAAVGAGLWFGGGPTARQGWEVVSLAAGITAAMALITTAIAWAITSKPSPPPTPLPDSADGSDVVNTVNDNVSGGTVIQGRDVHVKNSSYGGDRIDFSNSTFHRPVTGKQEVHHHDAAHKVDWPIRVGAIPEQAAHHQRRAIADQLDQALTSFGTVVLRQVLSGTGGVGKTQLASRHARTLARITDPEQRVDVLVWANATSREQIIFAYAHAARYLYATVPDAPEEAAKLFLTWLQDTSKHHNRRWLIVWDNLADPATVHDLWPPHDQPHGRVLVTTRRRDHSLTTQGRHLLDVNVYTPAEAHAFLTHALDEAGIPHDNQDLMNLAQDLGFLPLALGQAVTYMAELGLGCTDYLDLVRDRMRTLDEVFPDWGTPTPFAATWELSLAQANAFTPYGVARPLMGLISLLDGSGIPETVLTARPVLDYLSARRTHDAAAPHAPDTSTPPTPVTPVLALHEVRATLANLRRLNLITRTNMPPRQEAKHEDILVGAHQLIQRATREYTTTRPDRHSVRALANALLKAWPEVERDTALAQQLRSNATVLRSHHAVEGRSSEDWLWKPDVHVVLFRAGMSLGESGAVTQAIVYWQAMVSEANERLGPEHPRTLAARHNLAYWRGHSGDTDGAAHALEELLTDRVRVLGPNHPHTLITRHDLASWKGESGNTEGAQHALEELLTDRVRVLGPNHPHTLATRHSIARWRGHSGDTDGAAHALEELLTDRVRVLGPDHPRTLNTRHELARWLGESGNTEGAQHALEKLLTDELRVLGPDHPRTLNTRHELARWRRRAKDVSS